MKDSRALVKDLGAMIEDAQQRVAGAANAALTTLYWRVGQRVRTEVLENQRADYGEQLVDRHERQPGEKPPLGLILCAGKKRETVESMNLDARGIHVAEYMTELPPREVLEDRLHRAIKSARARLAPNVAMS